MKIVFGLVDIHNLFPDFLNSLNGGYNMNGFTLIQSIVDRYYVSLMADNNDTDYNTQYQVGNGVCLHVGNALSVCGGWKKCSEKDVGC